MPVKKRRPPKLGYGVGQKMVEEFFKNKPGHAFRNAEVTEGLGLYPGTVSTATRTLWLMGKLRRIQTGMYVYDLPEARPNANSPAPMERKRTVRAPRPPSMNHVEPVEHEGPTMFETVAESADGRLILRDELGAFWIAGKL